MYGRSKLSTEIAHAWAHGNKLPADSKHSSLKYYNQGDDKIYSYGSHFIIAQKYGGKILMTLQGYSNTTSKHIREVEMAVSHLQKVYVWGFPAGIKDTETHQKNINVWKSKLVLAFSNMKKARKLAPHIAAIENVRNQVKSYTELFNVRLTKGQKELFFNTDLAQYNAIVEKENKAKAAKEVAEIKQGIKLLPEWLEMWRTDAVPIAGKEKERALAMKANDAQMNAGGFNTRLRVVADTMETSLGIKVPVNIARRYYNQYLQLVQKGGCAGDCKIKMLDFEVKSITADMLIVGCHSIPRSEINYIAQLLNW